MKIAYDAGGTLIRLLGALGVAQQDRRIMPATFGDNMRRHPTVKQHGFMRAVKPMEVEPFAKDWIRDNAEERLKAVLTMFVSNRRISLGNWRN